LSNHRRFQPDGSPNAQGVSAQGSSPKPKRLLRIGIQNPIKLLKKICGNLAAGISA